ncbi:hypothetical protein CFC21_097882 [Triticum aestivum]|uniref:F-box domain-containing protein n=2 Tax=Triticum aestivum TaxID=4565 RepID=A0A3B5XVK3_WHEAT|nr:uncharacterized protein LOC123188281 [Triticum aestivum]KAF7095805.1 hypothetical protein CFC21_097882 [Triticum aestivum]
MELPPLKLNVARGEEDRISALPDELLLRILERLGLRRAVRAGTVSKRWRHLPHQLSFVTLDVRCFRRATLGETMDAFTAALTSVCAQRNCECQRGRVMAMKAICLRFFLSASHLSSIGSAVEDVVSHGKTRRLAFQVSPPPGVNSFPQIPEMGQQFMSFSRAHQPAFQCLTRLRLKSLAFGNSDVAALIAASDKLEHLNMNSCGLVDQRHVLKIDTPCSVIQELEFKRFHCKRIHLISVPRLRTVLCHSWRSNNPPMRFGYVPQLRQVNLACKAKAWQVSFLLSRCFSRRSANNLLKLHLNFRHQMIWIRPEHPKHLTAIFRNLAEVSFSGIFPECDLSWTLFILQVAPALHKFTLSRERHACDIPSEDSADKTNVVWEPSKDLKHLKLKLLRMYGFEDEDKVTNYIRLVMERAVGLKRIELRGEVPCEKCDAIYPRRSQVDKGRRRRIKERLTHESSSNMGMIMLVAAMPAR